MTPLHSIQKDRSEVGARPDGPGSREPSPSVSAASVFDPSRIESVAKIIDPDAWHQTLPADGCGIYWIGRRNTAKSKARAAIAVMNGWRPFRDAPQDGSVILAYRSDAGVFTAHYVEEDAHLASVLNPPEGDFYWFTTGGEDLTSDLPSHWMELPVPPRDSDGSGGAGETVGLDPKDDSAGPEAIAR